MVAEVFSIGDRVRTYDGTVLGRVIETLDEFGGEGMLQVVTVQPFATFSSGERRRFLAGMLTLLDDGEMRDYVDSIVGA